MKRGSFLRSAKSGGGASEGSEDGSSVVDLGRFREMRAKHHSWAVAAQRLEEQMTSAEQRVESARAKVRSLERLFQASQSQLDEALPQWKQLVLQAGLDQIGPSQKKSRLDHSQELDALKAEVENLRKQDSLNQQRMSDMILKMTALEHENAVAKQDLSDMIQKMTTLEQENTLSQQDFADMSQKTATLEQETRTAQNAISIQDAEISKLVLKMSQRDHEIKELKSLQSTTAKMHMDELAAAKNQMNRSDYKAVLLWNNLVRVQEDLRKANSMIQLSAWANTEFK